MINNADGFYINGDSGNDRFPGFSSNAYTKTNKRFFCLDLGGLTASRGPTKGGKVYTSVAELPADQVGDLAILWVKPPGRRAGRLQGPHADDEGLGHLEPATSAGPERGPSRALVGEPSDAGTGRLARCPTSTRSTGWSEPRWRACR